MARHIEFSKFDKFIDGKPYCRNCDNPVKAPYRYYCSRECQQEFILTHDWEALRWHILSKHRICQECKQFKSEEVHHIVEVHKRPDLMFDRKNLIALCKICHDSKRYRKSPSFSKNKKSCKLSISIEFDPLTRIKEKNIKLSEDLIKRCLEEKFIDPLRIVIYCVIYDIVKPKNKIQYKKYVTEFNTITGKEQWLKGIYKKKKLKSLLITPELLHNFDDKLNAILEHTCYMCPDRFILKKKRVVKNNLYNYL